MDFDYTTETITPDNTNILTIGGTGGLEVPFGTTSQRPPSPSNGIIRYNTDTGQLEGYYSNSWTSSTNSFANTVIVQKTPGAGQFSSIKEAVDSITTATSSSPWIVQVYPGEYVEDTIVLKEYVTVAGVDKRRVKIVANDPDVNLIEGVPAAAITNVSLIGATGTGACAIYYEPYQSLDTFRAYSIHFGNNYTFVKLQLNSGVTFGVVDLDDSTTEILISSVRPFVCTSAGGLSYLYITTFRTQFVYAPEVAITCHGPGAYVGTWNSLFARPPTSADSSVGMSVYDGGELIIQNTELSYWGTGLLAPNTGSAPIIFAEAAFFNSTIDIDIQHPGTTGSISGSAERERVFINSSAPISVAYSHNKTPGMTITGDLFLGTTNNNTTSVTDLIQLSSPTGVLSGGVISRGASALQVDISAGFGYLIDTVTEKDAKVEWSTTVITLPDDSPTIFIYIDNTGTPTFGTSQPDLVKTILLGRAYTASGTIEFITQIPISSNSAATYLDNFLRVALGPIFGTGALVSENASVNRKLDVTAGIYYYSKLDILVIGGTPVAFGEVYHVSGSFVGIPASSSIVNNTQYDNLTNLVNLTSGYYTKHTLYVGGQGSEQVYILLFGQSEYAN